MKIRHGSTRPLVDRALPRVICTGLVIAVFLGGCAGNNSIWLYRLPYADGTEVCVGRDHLTHTPQQNRFDLAGVGGSGEYRVVAAQTGVVRIIKDDMSQNCCGNPSCGNNYVWIEHVGGEWSKYSHLAQNSVSVDAGLEEDDVVVAGEFIGIEDDVGRACSRCGSTDHVHFEVGVPTDPANPILNPAAPNNGGFLAGANRRARFCNVQAATLVQGRNEVASRCDVLLACLQSSESPSTEGNCQEGLGGEVCVREVSSGAAPIYTRGVDFTGAAVKINLEWCAGPNCDPGQSVGRGVVLQVMEAGGAVNELVLDCNNRSVSQAFGDVEEIRIESLQASGAACNGNTVPDAFARWEICEVPSQLLE